MIGCKGKESTAITAHTETSLVNVAVKKTLTVDFYSKGAGINRPAAAIMVEFLKKPIDGVNCEFESNLANYGREGERQYCMTFNDEKCYAAMYKLVTEKLGGQNNVRIEEDGKCKKSTR